MRLSRGGRSGSDRVFRYRCIEPIRVFLHFGSGSDIFSSGSVISGRFGYLDFKEKRLNSSLFKFFIFQIYTFNLNSFIIFNRLNY